MINAAVVVASPTTIKKEEEKMKNLQKDITKKQLEVRLETINVLIATFGDADGKLAKALNEVHGELEKINNLKK